MKRSQINAILQNAAAFTCNRGSYLPLFAYNTPQDWAAKGVKVQKIVKNRLGWEITGFDRGSFDLIGLSRSIIR